MYCIVYKIMEFEVDLTTRGINLKPHNFDCLNISISLEFSVNNELHAYYMTKIKIM